MKQQRHPDRQEGGINPLVAQSIEGIRQDKVHGAGWLSRQSLGVIRLAVEKSEARAMGAFIEELTTVGRELVESRPSMVSIANGVVWLIHRVVERSREEENLSILKGFALSESDSLVRYSEEAALKAAEQGAKVIGRGDRLITCSYSSTVCQTFRRATVEGKGIEVIAADSGSYGKATAEQLRLYGIPVQVIPDEAIRRWMPLVNKALAGADAILSDGSLVNGSPTYELALAAKDNGNPFYAVAETMKLDVWGCLGQEPRLETGFERIPGTLITGIVTEEGLIEPGEVFHRIKRAHLYGH